MRLSIASPSHIGLPRFFRRVGIRNFTFEACSDFTRVTAHWLAQPPKAAFVARLRSTRLPGQTACQLPDQSTTHWVETSSTGDTRRRGALRGRANFYRRFQLTTRTSVRHSSTSCRLMWPRTPEGPVARRRPGQAPHGPGERWLLDPVLSCRSVQGARVSRPHRAALALEDDPHDQRKQSIHDRVTATILQQDPGDNSQCELSNAMALGRQAAHFNNSEETQRLRSPSRHQYSDAVDCSIRNCGPLEIAVAGEERVIEVKQDESVANKPLGPPILYPAAQQNAAARARAAR